MANHPTKSLLDTFKEWEIDNADDKKLHAGSDEFQIIIPIFNYTINVVRDCFDGTNCNYLTYSDNGLGGIKDSFTWDE